MRARIHFIAAKHHFKIAEVLDKRCQNENNIDEKIALRTVAAQNYFYASINFIEYLFAEKLEQHSFNHENRMRKMLEHRSLFSEEIVELYELVDRDLRNKVAYRGENGKKYNAMRKLARLLFGENGE